MTRRLGTIALCSMLTLVAVACGDDEDGKAASSASGGATAAGGFGGTLGGGGTLGSGGTSQGGAQASGGTNPSGMGGMAMGSGGFMNQGGAQASGGTNPSGMGGMAMGSGGAMNQGGAQGSGGMGAGGADPNDEFSALRQGCVDYINMYRATLGLDPLRRASPEQEACSDEGAELDATTGGPHASAGDCSGLGAQNTCPGWPGNDVESSLERCLDAMWDEGEPPQGVQACIADRTGCFQAHGHWINMSSSTSTVVSCGFYRMPNGSVWMNQDFGR